MKVFLDDIRPAPIGWVRCYWPEEVIDFLKTGAVSVLSLDHDLGNDEYGTGYTVLLWIEEQVVNQGFVPPVIYLHTSNISAKNKMLLAVGNINKLTRSVSST